MDKHQGRHECAQNSLATSMACCIKTHVYANAHVHRLLHLVQEKGDFIGSGGWAHECQLLFLDAMFELGCGLTPPNPSVRSKVVETFSRGVKFQVSSNVAKLEEAIKQGLHLDAIKDWHFLLV